MSRKKSLAEKESLKTGILRHVLAEGFYVPLSIWTIGLSSDNRWYCNKHYIEVEPWQPQAGEPFIEILYYCPLCTGYLMI